MAATLKKTELYSQTGHIKQFRPIYATRIEPGAATTGTATWPVGLVLSWDGLTETYIPFTVIDEDPDPDTIGTFDAILFFTNTDANTALTLTDADLDDEVDTLINLYRLGGVTLDDTDYTICNVMKEGDIDYAYLYVAEETGEIKNILDGTLSALVKAGLDGLISDGTARKSGIYVQNFGFKN